MGGSSSQTIGQRYFAKLTTFIGNPIEKLIGINFDNRGWIFKPDNDESFLRVESPNLYGDKEGGVAGFIDIHTGTADQLPNTTYSADFPKVSGYPFQSYLLFRGLGKGVSSGGVVGEIAGIIAKRHHYNKSFYHGNSGYMKEMLLWPQRVHVRNDGRPQWYDEKAEIGEIRVIGNKDALLPAGYHHFTRKIVEKYPYWDDENLSIDDLGQYSASSNQLTASMQYFGGIAVGISGYEAEEEGIYGGEYYTYFEIQGYPNVGIATATYQIEYIAKSMSAKWTVLNPEALLYNRKISTNKLDGRIFETYEVAIDLSKAIFIKFELICSGGVSVTSNINKIYIGTNIYFDVINYHEYQYLEYGNINPIHKVREILTDDTAMNKPESDVNEDNFKKAADRIWHEGLGISWAVTEKSCLEAINELCGHVEAGIRMNRQTGLYEMVLFRDDWFDDDEIHTLPANKIKSMQLNGATSADELINKLNVSYYNRDAIKNSSFSIAENAAIRNLKGHENSEEVKFPYFTNQRNPAVVAQWKLKQMSTPVWQGTFTTGFYQARKWNRYDLLKLAWPRKWAGTILVRIMKINLGTGTDVSIDFVEVVPYSSDLSSSIVIDTPVETTPKPPQPALFKAFELSYLEAVQLNGQKAVDEALAYNPDAGYAAVIAKRPQTNSLNALMYTDTGNDYERAGAIAYSETAELDQSISKTDTAFIVKQAGDIDMVSIGTQITVNHEIMVYESHDKETGLLTVKRGVLDTVPQNHLAGSILYFADDFVTVDPTEYVTGEIINVKALTTTPSGILSLDDVDAQPVEIQARAIRPYPPADVKINGAYWPETHIITNDIVLIWSHRNRVQQTGGEIIGWYEGGVTIESGVTYSYELTSNNSLLASASNITSNTATINASALIPNRAHTLKLWSVRDGYQSYQIFEHSFFVETVSLILTATVSKDRAIGSTVPSANIFVNVDESLKANMHFDGSSISGKADTGATITIEIEE
ncbi:hypothetical protein [Acinetobacter johnsonii]|uniref:hypothetical protein n=1 Tax=Acinetobacter johnsonii TaxID=40214 RepID=UPI003AF4B073